MGGTCDSPPASCSNNYGKMDVYVKGTDGGCWRKPYGYGSGGGWGSWENSKLPPPSHSTLKCPAVTTLTAH